MNTKKPKMLVISLDAVGSGDIEKAMELPGFARFFDGASRCMSVHSVYPSITYPAHTSIVTGRYPVHHGIVDNTKIQPNRKSPDWYWQRKYIRGTTLYDEALKQGMTVAALLWPVTARSKITWNLPEIFAKPSVDEPDSDIAQKRDAALPVSFKSEIRLPEKWD